MSARQPAAPVRPAPVTPARAPAPRTPAAGPRRAPGTPAAGSAVRWAAFVCLLVPVTLAAYGTSAGGAATAWLGLAAVTCACRLLLHQSRKREDTARAHPREGARRGAGGAPHV
ncbi:hypothetical protein ACFU9F_19350 [Streptomyces zhihengii]|uniref:hypothetical protein n=1 Tax=Streptomyces zhihengii TaxID=1818004 RepID=UPI00369CB68D